MVITKRRAIDQFRRRNTVTCTFVGLSIRSRGTAERARPVAEWVA